MADKPSRALVLYGDGLARSINPSHTHLHSFASKACCGFLSLPQSPPSENEDARIIREFVELIDASGTCTNLNGDDISEVKIEEMCERRNLSERFMGMNAALVTGNSNLEDIGTKNGLRVLQFNELIPTSRSVGDSSLLATELLKLLGFHDGETSETSKFDLLFVHVGSGEEINSLRDIEFVNGFVGATMEMVQASTGISSRLHMSVLMSFGAVTQNDTSNFSISVNKEEKNSELQQIFPRQSYTIRAGKPRENIREYCSMLIAQWQKAVTRKDKVETYSFKDFLKDSGNLVIPADRFLHEIAFKLWKAPKYGA